MGNCRDDVLARAFALLPQLSSIVLQKSLAFFELTIAREFIRDANLSSFNEESCSTVRLTWPLLDRRRRNQLFRLDRDIISTTAVMLTDHCVMGKDAALIHSFCRKCRSDEEEETVIYLFCQWPSLTRCRDRLFSSPFLVSFAELLSIGI